MEERQEDLTLNQGHEKVEKFQFPLTKENVLNRVISPVKEIQLDFIKNMKNMTEKVQVSLLMTRQTTNL